MKRLFAGFLAVAMVLTLGLGVSGSASAQTMTVAQIQAMIAQLQAQLAGLTGGSSAGYMFNADLTLGSTGADVSALQQMLVSKGFLTMPAGVAMGYFGNLTKAAVAAWQAANGISPAVGYFGPKSRGVANAMSSTGGTGTGTGTGTSTGGITTVGAEGTITATLNPTPGSGTKLYEGDSNRDVAGVKLEAKNSDILVQRLKVQLVAGTSGNSDSQFYNKIVKRLSVKDGSTVLATVDLDSSSVVKEGSSYYVTIAGFNFLVPKNATKVLTISADAFTSWDSTYDGDTWTITFPSDAVRGVDGAGVNQYSPTSSFSRSFTSNGDLVDDATLQVSLNTGSVVAAENVASQGSNENELDGLTLMTFDVKAEKDNVLITDLVASITRGGTTSTATATTAYLYDGSTLVGSASVDGTSLTAMTATFSDIDYSVPMDVTKTLTLKVDIDSAGTAATTFSATVTASSGVTAENSIGDTLASADKTGSASSETQTVRSVGPVITLVSKSITKSSTPVNNNVATSTAQGDFSLKIKAVGGDIMFGSNASTTYPMVSNGTGAPARSFIIYLGGSSNNPSVNASSTSFDVPSSGVVTSGLTNSFTLQENNEVTIPVSFLFEARTSAGAAITTGSYAIGLERINWVSSAGQDSSTFMSGKTNWRTSTVSLP